MEGKKQDNNYNNKINYYVKLILSCQRGPAPPAGWSFFTKILCLLAEYPCRCDVCSMDVSSDDDNLTYFNLSLWVKTNDKTSARFKVSQLVFLRFPRLVFISEGWVQPLRLSVSFKCQPVSSITVPSYCRCYYMQNKPLFSTFIASLQVTISEQELPGVAS